MEVTLAVNLPSKNYYYYQPTNLFLGFVFKGDRLFRLYR